MPEVLSPALRSLLEVAANLIRVTRTLSGEHWNASLAQRTAGAVERLADHAANLDLAKVRTAALGLSSCLRQLGSESMPAAAQFTELGARTQGLDGALSHVRGGSMAVANTEPRPDVTSTSPLIAIWAGLDTPRALARAWIERGGALLALADASDLAEQAKVNIPIAILAGSEQIVELNAALDELARHLPASANMIVVGIGGDHDSDRLCALLGGCDLYVASGDDPTLVTQILELTQIPDPPFRVLLVDDDATTRLHLRSVLQQTGMVVDELPDSNAVEDEIARFKPDLLLVDLFMPEVDGVTLTMRLRARANLAIVPILFLSSELGDQARLRAIRAGGDDFLTKPVRVRSLVASVRDHIQRARRLHRQLESAASAASGRGGRSRRGAFLAKLAQVAVRQAGRWRVLLAVKIDQFEDLQQRLTLAGAYELEQSIDLRLLSVLCAEDSFALWQEFGFGMLVERATPDQLRELAGQLCGAVAGKPFRVLGADMRLTASIGIALAPGGAEQSSADRWIAAAFAAQAVAHRLGGDRFEGVLDLEPDGPPAERILMIRDAVTKAGKCLNVLVEFQPILRLHGIHKDQYAAITKLLDARAPLAGVSRDEYREIARTAGALAAIDRVAMARAIEALDEENLRGRSVRITVPMDLWSFNRAQLLWLDTALRQRGTYGASLMIEFDANQVLDRPSLMPILHRLRSLGVDIALDERSGSLTRVPAMQLLPVTTLRIPRTAIGSMSPSEFSTAMGLWRASGRSVIVDQVDDVAAVMRLWSFGVDYLQGNGLAAPGPRLDYSGNDIEAAD